MAAFPYSVVYRVTPGAIQVFAVTHAKRRPQYWRKRRFWAFGLRRRGPASRQLTLLNQDTDAHATDTRRRT